MLKKYSLLVFGVFLSTVAASSVYAQRNGSATIFPLLDQAQCTDASTARAELKSWDGDISIGRQLHNVSYYMQTREGNENFALLACEVNTAEFDTLSLQLGIADNVGLNHDATVKIYQGGSLLDEYRQLGAGAMVEYTVDLLNTSVGNSENIAIEYLCDNTDDVWHTCYLYLVEAELTPTNYVPVN